MPFSKRWIASVVALCSLSCGGAPPPASPASASAAPADAGPVAVPVAAVDTSPVPAPPNLTIVLRVRNAQALNKSVRELAGSIFPILQSFTVDAAAQVFLGSALADVIDLTKPVDVGIAGEGTAAALSFPLASFDDARQNLAEDFDFVSGKDGVIDLAPKKKGSTKLHCEMRPAAGDSPYRLVCAPSPSVLHALGPYLTRTVARDPTPDDVRMEFLPGAMASKIEAQEADGSEAFTAGREYGRKLVLDTFKDLQSFSVDVTLGKDAVEASAAAALGGANATLVRIALDEARDPKSLPDSFWRLPSDALGAFYARGADPADLAEMKKSLLDYFTSDFRKDGQSDASIDIVTKALDSTLFTGGPIALAYGFDIPASVAALSKSTPKQKAERRFFHGWGVIALDEPASRWVDAVHAIDAAPWKETPEEIERTRTEKTYTRFKQEPLDKKLPAHSAHFVSRTYPRKNGKVGATPTQSLHFIVVPNGNGTLAGFGENEAQVVAKLKEVLANTPDKGLAARTDLQLLHSPTGFGGFVTPALVDTLGAPDDGSDIDAVRALIAELSQPGDDEITAIPFVMPGSSGPKDGLKLQAAAPNAVVKSLLLRAK